MGPTALLAMSLVIGDGDMYDMGPTFGADRPGADVKATLMHSPRSAALDHYRATALQCEALCEAAPECCAWSYLPPTKALPHDRSRDYCGFKAPVTPESRRPPPSGDTHRWVGLARRAVTDSTNSTLSAQCKGPWHPKPKPPPGPSNGSTCPWPPTCKGLWDRQLCTCYHAWSYPGPDWRHPRVHNSPSCLHNHGWHDMAGTITTTDGTRHFFQGCPDLAGDPVSGHDLAGWHHASSKDFVHFENHGVVAGLSAKHERYDGMTSFQSPCAGFITIDPDTRQVCAGFRQCHGGDPAPLEFRCAPPGDSNLSNWSQPEFVESFNPRYAGRSHEPYDPVRPWIDSDGFWYGAVSLDGCNKSVDYHHCGAGGALMMFRSQRLRGPKADWRAIGPLFVTNTTKSGLQTRPSAFHDVFVTSEFIGGLRGDPAGGATRCVLANTGVGSAFWCGRQEGPGSQMQAYWDKPGAVGFYDYGVITCARTITQDVNKVLPHEARHTLSGNIEFPWHGMFVASQSLARDLSLSPQYELLQQFVPELEDLRIADTEQTGRLSETVRAKSLKGALQLEVIARFVWPTTAVQPTGFGFSFMSGAGNVTIDCSRLHHTGEAPCMVVFSTSVQPVQGVVTMPVLPAGERSVSIHTVLDGEILEMIVNNRTAMVHQCINAEGTNATDIVLFGPSDVSSTITTWELQQANNFRAVEGPL